MISSFQRNGPVVITGDFNAHLGKDSGPRVCGDKNAQGILLQELINRASLYPISVSSLATGPLHTYSHAGNFTTVDYYLIDHVLVYATNFCNIHEQHPLNLSDHLPISISLNLQMGISCEPAYIQPRPNWRKAASDGSIKVYQSELSRHIAPSLSRPLTCIEEVEDEIKIVTDIMHKAANSSLPHRTRRDNKKLFIHDNSLKEMCRDSKEAWRRWRNAGRPKSGVLYADMKHKKHAVKQYVNTCRARHERKRLQQRDTMLRNNESGCFHVPKKQSTCHKLQADGVTATNATDLLQVWVSYFDSLKQMTIPQ